MKKIKNAPMLVVVVLLVVLITLIVLLTQISSGFCFGNESCKVDNTISQCRRIIETKNNNWEQKYSKKLNKLIEATDDKQYLLDRLLASDSSYLHGEAIILAFNTVEDEEQLMDIVNRFDDDNQYNRFSITNSELSLMSVLALKIKSEENLTSEENQAYCIRKDDVTKIFDISAKLEVCS